MDMSKILQKVDILKAKIDELRPFSKELRAMWQERLRIDWTYNSNAIEGNTLTYGETAFFLREGLTSEGKPLKDYIEAENHAEAIDWLYEVVKSKRNMTESFIKELHALLLSGIEYTLAKGAHGKMVRKPLNSGKYKTRPNHVLTLSGAVHKYTDPIHVNDEMQILLKWYSKSGNHPVEKALIFHYRFVCIHPFDDGNGRMARLLMNLLLMKAGYPPCIVQNVRRREYLKSLEKADKSGSCDDFLEFLMEELMRTQSTMLEVLKGKALPPILGERLNRKERIDLILKAFGKETLAIGQIHDRVPQIKRPTLKSDLKLLLKKKVIRRKGVGKGVVYFAA
jgi:Fic family protein